MAKFKFGPAGKPVSYRGSIQGVPRFLREMGLNAFEYQAVRGVRISEEQAKELALEAVKNGVLVSLHAPYFINLSSLSESTLRASIERLCESVRASKHMNAYVTVFHPGYYKGSTPREALSRAINSLKKVEEFRNSIDASNVWLGPETVGKTSQLGSLRENIEICRAISNCRPVIDWAHIYARTRGGLITSIDHVIKVVEEVEVELGSKPIKPLHMHFSKIEYGKGGEREHHALSEVEYGPSFELVCEGLTQVGVEGVFISESPLLEKDALLMKDLCSKICGVNCIAD
ncbi:MAG: TIM barrel protein [Sulfolobales archaeon]|nr:TIM barrel protein [Sulfolobales archaeon]MCX8199089.1 TIM barrel protein [Sulfolobales archaeon]MDW8170068.1 TIM barrel protein [Desulfurococcaceae archaeon]